MSLSHEQYNNIMLKYTQRRDAHKQELAARRLEVWNKLPAYKALEDEIPSLSVRALEQRLMGDKTLSDSAAEKIRAISAQKKELLVKAGYPADYLELTYDCPACRDTGYIDNVKCSCLRRQEAAILYDQSHLGQLSADNNFSKMTTDWYKGESLTDFSRAVQACRSFINCFDTRYENLYFYGTVGTGKSFLSISTATEIVRSGKSVLYFSAAGLFDTLSNYVFGGKSREVLRSFTDDLYNCDLLVIDDLGTEVSNTFVSAQLFACINERHLNHKSTIISTNLSLSELRDRYSDRIFSRITSSYTVCRLTGPDIRILKKMRRNNGTS